MATGVWSMDDDGNFELQEPYKTMLSECKMAATDAWRNAINDYLVEHSPYESEELNEELIRRIMERDMTSMEILDEFIIESLSGDLIPIGSVS